MKMNSEELERQVDKYVKIIGEEDQEGGWTAYGRMVAKATRVTKAIEDSLKLIVREREESESEYEVLISKIAAAAKGNKKNLSFLEELLKKHVEAKGKEGLKSAYAIFYTLHICYRWMKEYKKLDKMVKEYGPNFEDQHTYSHLELIVAAGRFYKGEGASRIFDYVEKAEELANKYPNHIGIIHNFGNVVATAYEYETIESEKSKIKEYVDLARGCVERAIKDSGDKKPRFYYTMGRLFAMNEEYEKAITYVLKAISKDASEKITTYELYLDKLFLMREIRIERENLMTEIKKERGNLLTLKNEMDEKTNELDHKLNEMATKNLELLVFFAAIITLIIASIQMVYQGESVITVLPNYLLFFGVLMSAFGALVLSLNAQKDQSGKKVWVGKFVKALILLVGLASIGGAIYFTFFFNK